MRAFILPEGSSCEIMTLDETGKRVWRHYATKEEHLFVLEELDFNPITFLNTGVPHKDTWEGKLAAEGMVGIIRKGKKSGGMYMLVVDYQKLSVH